MFGISGLEFRLQPARGGSRLKAVRARCNLLGANHPAGSYGPASRLEVWSEILGPPPFEKTTRQIGDATDDHLDFGSMAIGAGRALTLEVPQGRTWSAPVMKTLTKTPEGRTFLVEAVQFSAVQAQLMAAQPVIARVGRVVGSSWREVRNEVGWPSSIRRFTTVWCL